MKEVSFDRPSNFEMQSFANSQTQQKYQNQSLFHAPLRADASMHSISHASQQQQANEAINQVQNMFSKISLGKENQDPSLWHPMDGLKPGVSHPLPRISEFPASDLSRGSKLRATPSKGPMISLSKLKREEPSFYQEFVECSSKYDLPRKVDDEEISDDEEFNDARHIRTYNQEATEVLRIEQEQQYGSGVFGALYYKKLKEQGVKSHRNKDLKYFTEVGYQGDDNKPIPRWAVDMDMLRKCLRY